MISPEILSVIKNLEIKTKRMLSGGNLGDYKTAFKGYGSEFESLRDYEPGDDIRFIDWKSSARTQKLLVKKYLEDRNKRVLLVVDISESTKFGSSEILKSDMIKQLASILAFTSFFSKDSVGLWLFSDELEFNLKQGSSRGHIFSLLKELLTFEAKNKKTDLNKICNLILQRQKTKSIICIISDFLSPIDPGILRILSKKHEVMLFQCVDKNETTFPEVGILSIEDLETGVAKSIDTKNLLFNNYFNRQSEMFRGVGVSHNSIFTDKLLMPQVVKCLKLLITK